MPFRRKHQGWKFINFYGILDNHLFIAASLMYLESCLLDFDVLHSLFVMCLPLQIHVVVSLHALDLYVHTG